MNKFSPASIKVLLREAEAELTDQDSARLDAEVLLAWVLGLERSQLYARPESEVASEQTAQFQAMLQKRKTGLPLAYLTGTREFWSLPLKVNEFTLVPRPETECLVEAVLDRLAPEDSSDVLDLGTGSGAIALAVGFERPRARVTAVDISEEALQLASTNATELGLDNISFCHSDWFAVLGQQQYDMIVSNPPYVESSDPLLVSSGIKYEPRVALDGGADGLDAYREILPAAWQALRPGGHLLLEHGSGQAAALTELLTMHHFHYVVNLKDYAGLDRLSCARKE